MSFFKDVVKAALPAVGGATGPIGMAAATAAGGVIQGQENREEIARQEAERADNIKIQREFAQHGIRWKVEDAKAAGIHPLVGLGAQTANFSPVSIGGSGPSTTMSDMADMGQNISRSISATRTQEERELAALNVQGARLDLNGKALDNQIKQAQLSRMNSVGPAMPGSNDQSFIPGQGAAGGNLIMTKPMERTTTLKGSPQAEPGTIADVGWAKTKTGVVPIPSSDVKQRIEDNLPHEISHFFRNNVAPNWGGGTSPPPEALPKGASRWKWNYSAQEFQPYFPPKGGGSSRRNYPTGKEVY